MMLKAHRCVLAAVSDFFSHMFKDLPTDDIYVSVKDYRYLNKSLLIFCMTNSDLIHFQWDDGYENVRVYLPRSNKH